MPKPPPAASSRDNPEIAGEEFAPSEEQEQHPSRQSSLNGDLSRSPNASDRIQSPFQQPLLPQRARSSSPQSLHRASSAIAGPLQHFERLERNANPALVRENRSLQNQNREAREKIQALETESKKQKAELREQKAQFASLSIELETRKNYWEQDREKLKQYEASLSINESKLLGAREGIKRDVEEYKAAANDYKTKMETFQREKYEALLQVAALKAQVEVLEKEKRDKMIHMKTPSLQVSTLPKRPAFDPEEPGGVPNWAIGLYLYEEPQDQWHEIMIKQLLLRSQIAQHSQDFKKALDLAIEAGGHAYTLNNMPLLARCSYYRGRAEYALRQYRVAILSLEEAQSAKGRYAEGNWSQKDLRRAKSKWRKTEGLDLSERDTHSSSILNEGTILQVAGEDRLVLSTDRWVRDDEHEPPRRISNDVPEPYHPASTGNRKGFRLHRSQRSSSAPPQGLAERELFVDDMSVLLRPPSNDEQGCSYYYNTIYPSQRQKERHKRGSGSVSSVSLASSIEGDTSQDSDVETLGPRSQRQRASLPTIRSDSSLPTSSFGDRTSMKSHRKRPSQLNLGKISNMTTIASRPAEPKSAHYEHSDADDSPNVPNFQFPLRTPRTPRTPRTGQATPKVDPNTHKVKDKIGAPVTADQIQDRIKIHRPRKTDALEITQDDAGAEDLAVDGSVPTPNTADTLPNLLRAESDPTTMLRQAPTEAPSSAKAAKLLGLADRRSSLRDSANKQTDIPPSLQRNVSFAKSPTKRRKPGTKRASFPAPWTPPPPTAPETPTLDTTSIRPLLPPKGLPSPHSATGNTPPDTPRFVIVKQRTGKYRLEPDVATPGTAPLNVTTDLESELSEMDESLSPDYASDYVEVSPVVGVRSPLQADHDGVAVSTALEPPQTPNTLKPRSPRIARPKGIDTILANSGDGTRKTGSQTKREPNEDANDPDADHSETHSPHVKFAGEKSSDMPTLERRISTHDRSVSSAEATYTPKVGT